VLEGQAQGRWYAVERLLRVLDAVRAVAQCQRRGASLEAGVAAPDRSGGDEVSALRAAIPRQQLAPDRVALG
jgi:hypothetical protein